MPATTPSNPRRGRPGYDQRAVLEIAVAAFNEHGYDATSMGMLAARLGLSKSAIYHHVPSKGDLLRLALDEALTGLEAVLREDGATSGPAEVRLAFVVRGAMHVLVEKLPFVTLLLRLRGNSDVEREALVRRRAFDRAVAEIVVAARDEGSLRADLDPGIVTRLLFGMINSVVEWYQPGGPEGAGQLAEDVLTVALDGLRDPSRESAQTVLPGARKDSLRTLASHLDERRPDGTDPKARRSDTR